MLALDPRGSPGDADQFLAARRTDGDDEAAVRGQLVDQCLRHLGGRRRDQDGIERRLARPALEPIAVAEADVAEAERVQSLPGLALQARDALDREDLADESGEDRGLV